MKYNIVSTYGFGLNCIINTKELNGFYGISLGYPFFEDRSLEEYCKKYYKHKNTKNFIEFGKDYFKNFLIFIFDKPLKYNLMAFAGLNEESAEKEAIKISNIFQKLLLKNIKNQDHILIKNFSDIENNPRYIEIKNNLKNYAEYNKRFYQDLIDLTLSGTYNKLRVVKSLFGNKGFSNALEIAKEYSFMDIAACLFLYEFYPISISKYEWPEVLKKIYNKTYTDFSQKLNLSGKGHIQLSFSEYSFLKPYDDQFKFLTKKQ